MKSSGRRRAAAAKSVMRSPRPPRRRPPHTVGACSGGGQVWVSSAATNMRREGPGCPGGRAAAVSQRRRGRSRGSTDGCHRRCAYAGAGRGHEPVSWCAVRTGGPTCTRPTSDSHHHRLYTLRRGPPLRAHSPGAECASPAHLHRRSYNYLSPRAGGPSVSSSFVFSPPPPFSFVSVRSSAMACPARVCRLDSEAAPLAAGKRVSYASISTAASASTSSSVASVPYLRRKSHRVKPLKYCV